MSNSIDTYAAQHIAAFLKMLDGHGRINMAFTSPPVYLNDGTCVGILERDDLGHHTIRIATQ